MPSILNSPEKIKKLDRQNMAGSIEALPDQIKAVMEDYEKKIFPKKWKNIKNIVVAGMGGSSLGARVIKSLYFDRLNIPLEIVTNYYLPGFVDKNTLCVIISYSGNTEETLAALNEARKKTSFIFIIASGGKLADIAKKNNIAAHIFNDKFNPAKSPRMGLGYTMFSQLHLFKKLGLLDIKDAHILKMIDGLREKINFFGISNNKNNPAKLTALSLHNYIPILIGSDFLLGFSHVFTNQINESAKNFAAFFALPEANHHLLEGLQFPGNKNILKFLFIESDLYYPRNGLRYEVMKKVLRKNKIKYADYKCKGGDAMEQSLEILALSSWTSFYMSMLNKVDPAPVPNVNLFKKEMGKYKSMAELGIWRGSLI